MKNLLRIGMTTLFFCALFQCVVFANAAIDTSKSASGLVGVKYDGSLSAPIKAVVTKDGTQYIYTIPNNNINYAPFNMGTGSYVVSIMQSVGGNKYKPLKSETISVSKIDESAMYSASIMIVDYAVSKTAVPYFKELSGSKAGLDKLTAVYGDVVTNYSYDYDKAKTVPSDYVPVVDKTFSAKKGICYDYSNLVAGALRSQGIPTRLVMGYAPNISEYHAWNQVLIDGKWITIDTTADAQYVAANQKIDMQKDSSKYKVVKVY